MGRNEDERFMSLALELAKKGKTSPNPKVGCVIVKDGKIIGQGYHKRAGLPHAEIEAIKDARNRKLDTVNSTMYITLEPCSHEGNGKRTPPCTGAVLKSRVSRLVVAMKDPNPKVSGRGIRFLRERGMSVESGILEEQAKEINAHYAKWITKGVPYFAIKMAMSADGKIATRTGESEWISCRKSNILVHKMRSKFDAVMVGAGTVKKDDPRLTSRIKGGRNPIRIIVDSDLCLNPHSRFMRRGAGIIIVTTTSAKKQKIKSRDLRSRALNEFHSSRKFELLGAKVFVCGKREVDLKKLMRELGRLGIQSIMMEGGSELNSSAIEAGIVDKIYFFIAPIIIGGREAKGPIGGEGIERLSQKLKLKNVKMEKIGEDFLLTADL